MIKEGIKERRLKRRERGREGIQIRGSNTIMLHFTY